jgi:hypothetical protein
VLTFDLELVIGSESLEGLMLPDAKMPCWRARFFVDDRDQVRVEDAGSADGTSVNGIPR